MVFYIAGSSGEMPKAIRSTIKSIIQEGNLSSDPDETLTQMELQRLIQFETWFWRKKRIRSMNTESSRTSAAERHVLFSSFRERSMCSLRWSCSVYSYASCIVLNTLWCINVGRKYIKMNKIILKIQKFNFSFREKSHFSVRWSAALTIVVSLAVLICFFIY